MIETIIYVCTWRMRHTSTDALFQERQSERERCPESMLDGVALVVIANAKGQHEISKNPSLICCHLRGLDWPRYRYSV